MPVNLERPEQIHIADKTTNIAVYIMDKEFTKYIRDTVERDGYYYGSLLTEEEADAILDFDDEDDANPNLPTEAAEEMLLRSTGLNIDLSTQGAASLALSAISDKTIKSRNVLTVVKSPLRERTYDPNHLDTWLVPPRTIDDANVAVSSINFPQGRPSGTPLDSLRIDPKENPAESALSNALSFAQILHHWGSDVTELATFIDRTFGIDYALKLITQVSYAEVAELDEFLALGGRPSPQINISPNIVSEYVTRDKPAYTREDVEASSIFLGRHQELARYIAVMTNMCHGKGYKDVFSFEVNPAQFSTFDPASFNGHTVSINVHPTPSMVASSITNKSTYKQFIAARQPARVAIKAGERTLLKDLGKFNAMKLAKAKWGVPGGVGMQVPKDVLMTLGVPKTKKVATLTKQSAPSRVSAIATVICHRTDRDEHLDAIDAITMVNMLTSIIDVDTVHLAARWMDLISVKSFQVAMNAISVTDVCSIAEFDEKVQAADDQRGMAQLLIFHRHAMHQRLAVRDGVLIIKKIFAKEQLPSRMGPASSYMILGYPRLAKIIRDSIKGVPFTAAKSAAGKLYHRTASVSLVDLPAEKVAHMLAQADEEINASKVYVVPAKIYGRVFVAGMRETWSNFYMSRASSRIQIARAFIPGVYGSMSKCLANMKVILSSVPDEKDYGRAVVTGVVLEALIDYSMYLAYRYYSISLNGLKVTKDFSQCMGNYRTWLTKNFWEDSGFQKSISVDPHPDKLKSDSALSSEIDRICNLICNGENQTKAPANVLRQLYGMHVLKVSLTVGEVLRRDKAAITDWVDTSIPVEEKPSLPTVSDAELISAMKEDALTSLPHPSLAYSADVRLTASRLSMASYTVSDDHPDFREAALFMSDLERLNAIKEKSLKAWEVILNVADTMDTADVAGNNMVYEVLPPVTIKFFEVIATHSGYKSTKKAVMMEGP